MAASRMLACGDVAAVDAVAARLAARLRPGDAVLLAGAIGAGKTHFVAAVAAAMGSADRVTSPTYTLMHVYETPAARLLHLDAYRLSGVAEYRDLGIEDLAPDAVALVEWGDRVARAHPEHLLVRLAHVPENETARTLTLTGAGARWSGVPAGLAASA